MDARGGAATNPEPDYQGRLSGGIRSHPHGAQLRSRRSGAQAAFVGDLGTNHNVDYARGRASLLPAVWRYQCAVAADGADALRKCPDTPWLHARADPEGKARD